MSMSGSNAREARKATTVVRQTIRLGDLTLDELDEVEAVHQAEGVGRTAAVAWVFRRRKDPTYTLDQARTLTLREVHVLDDLPELEADEGPTSGP